MESKRQYYSIKNIKMKQVLFLVCIFILITSCKQINKETENKTENRPNVIVIVADDAGYIDFGFMGSEDLETPEIDKLAKSGVVFTDAHVSATVCAPSRAGIITGKYQQRFGFEANGTGFGNSGDIGLEDSIPTIGNVFKQNGYKTIAIGKRHLGGTENDHPNNKGFDEFYGFIGGSRSYFPIEKPNNNHLLQYNGTRVKFEGYLTDVLGDQSVKFVEDNKEHPFFMYLAYNAVHTPMEAKKEDLERYKNHSRQTLAAMTWSLDENIGKLRNKLQQLGILDNTLIYFISDNGGAHNNDSKMGPLKGWKGNKFEGGHRVPFIVSWPGTIQENKTFEGLSSSLDIFSTSLDAAGIVKNEELLLDGVSLLPYLKNEKTGDPHDKLFWRKLEEAGARVGDHKLIRLDNYGYTMYNVDKDLGETKDISKMELDTFNSVVHELKLWESKMKEPLWIEGKSWMDVTYNIHKQLMQNEEVLHKSPVNKNIQEKH